jgi:hypothetical protein
MRSSPSSAHTNRAVIGTAARATTRPAAAVKSAHHHGHRRFRIFVGIGAGAAGNLVRLGTQALDETRRRVQQEQTGHRGHKAGPLYEIRGLLRRGAEKLSDRQQARLHAALQVGDPDEEVTIAWHCAQQLRRNTTPAPPDGHRQALRGARPVASHW